MKIDLKKLLGTLMTGYMIYQANKPQIDELVRAGKDVVKPKAKPTSR